MLSWKAIVVVALIVGLIIIIYTRDKYINTISILGNAQGWRTALAASYRPLYFIFGYDNNEVAPTIAWWMEHGKTPTKADAVTIETLMSQSRCNASQALSFVRCDIEITPGNAPNDCGSSPPCGGSGTPASTGQSAFQAFFQYGVPLLGLGLMAFGSPFGV